MSFDLSSSTEYSTPDASPNPPHREPSSPVRRPQPTRTDLNGLDRRDDTDGADLVRALKANERGAFEQLVAVYHDRLCAVARTYVRDESDVSDVVQEVYLQVFKNIARFEENARLGTWLHRITVNAALMLLRSRRRRREQAMLENTPDAARPARRFQEQRSPASVLEEAEELARLHRQTLQDIQDLPATYRRIVHLRDIEELSNGDAATTLGITRAAAKSKLLRAHRHLRAAAAARDSRH